jgi:hypothetical protein
VKMGSRLAAVTMIEGSQYTVFNFSTYCKSTFLNSLRSSDVLKSSTIEDRFSEEDIVTGQEVPETIKTDQNRQLKMPLLMI